MNEIIVIGTEPACPRCGLLTRVIESKIKEMGLDASFKHLVYKSDEAKIIANKFGLIPGTANDVAKLANLKFDYKAIAEVKNNYQTDIDSEYYKYNDCGWSIELDNLLRPFEDKAREVGVMMTPVLIINGVIVHQGSVPDLTKIEGWLLELPG